MLRRSGPTAYTLNLIMAICRLLGHLIIKDPHLSPVGLYVSLVAKIVIERRYKQWMNLHWHSMLKFRISEEAKKFDCGFDVYLENVKSKQLQSYFMVLCKEYIERRHGEPFKFLFLPKMGLLGSQASTWKKVQFWIMSNFLATFFHLFMAKNLFFTL